LNTTEEHSKLVRLNSKQRLLLKTSPVSKDSATYKCQKSQFIFEYNFYQIIYTISEKTIRIFFAVLGF